MRFSLTDDEQMIAGSVCELCAKSVAPDAAAWDEAAALPSAIVTEVGELGLLGMSVPEAHGGVALSCVGRAAVLETLGGGSAALAMVVAMHDSLASGHLRHAGSAAQQEAHLPEWAGGETLATWCAPGPKLRATQTDSGWLLNGESPVTLAAAYAQILVVNADSDDGVVSLLVGIDDKGVRRTSATQLGLHAVGASRLLFEDVQVAKDAQLGEPTDNALGRVAEEHRIALAAVACGVGRSALRAAAEYANEREQFGRPIGTFQAIQWKLADAATELDAAALVTGRAAWLVDQGKAAGAASARAKVLATTAAERACSGALQIHGGYGYTREFPIERAVRAAKMLSAMAGTNRAARNAVAQAL